MFWHRHDWHGMGKYGEQTNPYGKHDFVKTEYYELVKCSKCGVTAKEIYNDWVHPVKEEDNHSIEWRADHSMIMRTGGWKYEILK